MFLARWPRTHGFTWFVQQKHPGGSLSEGRRKGFRGEVASPTVPHVFWVSSVQRTLATFFSALCPSSPEDAPHAPFGPAWRLLKALYPQPSRWSSPQGVWFLLSILENIAHNSVTHAHKQKQA